VDTSDNSIDWDNKQFVLNALVAIYNCQTEDEREHRQTIYENGVGFNALDAPILSSISKQLLRTNTVSEKQYKLVIDLLPKYTKQIALLKPSILVAMQPYAINIPPQKNNGMLKIEGDTLIFFPNIYPSVQVKPLGFYWRSNPSRWVGPVRRGLIEGVQRLFSNILLDDSVVSYIEEDNKLIELSPTVHDSSLFPYQKEATAFELKYKKCLMGLAPGTGKTASAIFAANELNCEKILVICPLSLTYMWKAQIKKWLNKEATIWHGKIDTWEEFDEWVITIYDTVVRNDVDILNQKFSTVVMDESILVKNRKALRSKQMKKIANSAQYCWLLSGSPVSKFYDDMWSQLNIVDPKRFSSYWRFAENYCVIEQNQWGTQIVGNQVDATERLKKDLSDVYFSRTMDEVLDIPDWIFDTIPVPMEKDQYKLYDQMENEFLADLPDGDQLLAPNVLSQMIRLIQLSSNPILVGGFDSGAKWKALTELLEFEEGPFIVWTNFIQTAHELEKRLCSKYSVGKMTGETPPELRQDIVDNFQVGNLDILIAHPAVGKFGLTLTKARTAIYLERSFNGDDYYQSLYRFRRIGTTASPHVIHLVAVRPDGKEGNTIDQLIDRVLDYRKNSSIAITSGFIRENLGRS
jgi:superfamily II DNA or RNA helicase